MKGENACVTMHLLIGNIMKEFLAFNFFLH